MFGGHARQQRDRTPWSGRGLPFVQCLTVWLLVFASVDYRAIAGPPRLLDENDPQFQPAAFEEPAALEPSRMISPRNQARKADGKPANTARKPAAPMSLWGTVAGLIVVFGVFLGTRVWLTKHGPAGFRGLPTEALELLGKRMIEPRVSVHLARCGPKILVLGVSPDGIRLLTEITDPVEVDLLAGACRRGDPQKTSVSFSGLFHQAEAVPSRSIPEEA